MMRNRSAPMGNWRHPTSNVAAQETLDETALAIELMASREEDVTSAGQRRGSEAIPMRSVLRRSRLAKVDDFTIAIVLSVITLGGMAYFVMRSFTPLDVVVTQFTRQQTDVIRMAAELEMTKAPKIESVYLNSARDVHVEIQVVLSREDFARFREHHVVACAPASGRPIPGQEFRIVHETISGDLVEECIENASPGWDAIVFRPIGDERRIVIKLYSDHNHHAVDVFNALR